MTSIDRQPVKLSPSVRKKRQSLPVTRAIRLAKPNPVAASFLFSLAQRRSADHFAQISENELSTWLYYTASIQSVHISDPNRQRRFVGSFGALHPAHILLGTPEGQWFTYVSEDHALGELVVDADVASGLRVLAKELFGSKDATLVALVSDGDLVSDYYENAYDLMLRDAGVLLGHSALVAAALGIAFRILGNTGAPLLEHLVPQLPFRPVATGLAWIGGMVQSA